uniref:Putative kinesin n=1 Tax=Trypanosoma vivax (strain Y486) TaxID=1055687 RepID=G0TSM1_TRYVY|nr:putative kinesin [Trypanosoma vivax Y486]
MLGATWDSMLRVGGQSLVSGMSQPIDAHDILNDSLNSSSSVANSGSSSDDSSSSVSVEREVDDSTSLSSLSSPLRGTYPSSENASIEPNTPVTCVIGDRNTKEELSISVAVRVRPPGLAEVAGCARSADAISVSRNGHFITLNGVPDDRGSGCSESLGASVSSKRAFGFERVFDRHVQQSEVYDGCARDAVRSALEGGSATIMAYGQKGTGKTYTMEGFGEDEGRGIIPRAVEDALAYAKNSLRNGVKCILRVSFMQIHNDTVSDLLVLPTEGRVGEAQPLVIRHTPQYGVQIDGLSDCVVENQQEFNSLMKRAAKLRAVIKEDGDAGECRRFGSHAVLVLRLESSYVSGVSGAPSALPRVGKLTFIDLVGVESMQRSSANVQSSGDFAGIGRSLHALGSVISALASSRGGKHLRHVPFRASSLTKLLRDALCGKGRMTLIACVSPGPNSYAETLSTLVFANCARSVRIQTHAATWAAHSKTIRHCYENPASLERRLFWDEKFPQESSPTVSESDASPCFEALQDENLKSSQQSDTVVVSQCGATELAAKLNEKEATVLQMKRVIRDRDARVQALEDALKAMQQRYGLANSDDVPVTNAPGKAEAEEYLRRTRVTFGEGSPNAGVMYMSDTCPTSLLTAEEKILELYIASRTGGRPLDGVTQMPEGEGKPFSVGTGRYLDDELRNELSAAVQRGVERTLRQCLDEHVLELLRDGRVTQLRLLTEKRNCEALEQLMRASSDHQLYEAQKIISHARRYFDGQQELLRKAYEGTVSELRQQLAEAQERQNKLLSQFDVLSHQFNRLMRCCTSEEQQAEMSSVCAALQEVQVFALNEARRAIAAGVESFSRECSRDRMGAVSGPMSGDTCICGSANRVSDEGGRFKCSQRPAVPVAVSKLEAQLRSAHINHVKCEEEWRWSMREKNAEVAFLSAALSVHVRDRRALQKIMEQRIKTKVDFICQQLDSVMRPGAEDTLVHTEARALQCLVNASIKAMEL